MRRVCVFLLALCLAPAWADDMPAEQPPKPLTPEQVADAVLAAFEAKDEAALKALAEMDDPDPWLVADELLRRGESDAALAFAKAAPRKDTERLPAYIGERKDAPTDTEARGALARATAELAKGDAAAALAVLRGIAVDTASVLGMRLRYVEGLALREAGRLEESAARLLAAADLSESLGWWARVTEALHECGGSAWRRSDFRTMLSALERRLAVEEARGHRAGMAETLGNIGIAYHALSDYPQALSFLGRSLALEEKLGDRAGVADTLGNIGGVHDSLCGLRWARCFYERSLALHFESR